MAEDYGDLIRRALAGDRAAGVSLVQAIRPVIQARAGRALLRRRDQRAGRDLRTEVEDLTQEVLAGLFAQRGKVLADWDPGRGLGLLGYVGLVAERDVASILRSKRRNPWTDEPAPDSSLERRMGSAGGPEVHTLERDLLARVLERVDAKLTDRGRQLFQLLLVEEQPVEEICRVFSMTAEAVYAWRSRLVRSARTAAAELASGPALDRRSTESE